MLQTPSAVLLRISAVVLASTAAVVAQAVPVSIPTWDNWTVTHNAARVTVQQIATRVRFDAIQGAPGVGYSPIQATTQFTVQQAGTYLLELDCRNFIAFGLSSADPVTWTIPGVQSDSWYCAYGYPTTRELAQWSVQLPAGTHSFVLDANVNPDYGFVIFEKIELSQVQEPAFVAGINSNWQSIIFGEFEIASSATLTAPNYVIYFSGSVLPAPLPYSFGTIELDNPVLLGVTNQTSWTASTFNASSTMQWMLASGTWWQVVEFDAVAPLSTLRLGTATYTESPF